MTYYRRNYKRSKRKYPRRKRVYKRTFKRKTRGRTNKIYSFKRTFESAQIVCNASAGVTGAFSLALADVPGASDFTNLFDQYRICGVKINMVPVYDAALSSAINKFAMFSVIDYNDYNTITMNQALEYQNVKRSTSVSGHRRYFKPRIAIQQTDYSNNSFVASYKPPWISTDDTNIAHGYMKYVTDTNSGSAAFTWNVYITLYLQFRNVN